MIMLIESPRKERKVFRQERKEYNSSNQRFADNAFCLCNIYDFIILTLTGFKTLSEFVKSLQLPLLHLLHAQLNPFPCNINLGDFYLYMLMQLYHIVGVGDKSIG